jgi:hypothetical protein
VRLLLLLLWGCGQRTCVVHHVHSVVVVAIDAMMVARQMDRSGLREPALGTMVAKAGGGLRLGRRRQPPQIPR